MHPATTGTKTGPLGIPWWVWMIAVVVYVVSPIDLIPEFPLGCIGVVDDLAAAAFGIYCLVRMFGGGGPVPAPMPAAVVQEPRIVSVEPRSTAPVLISASVVRQSEPSPIGAPVGGSMAGTFSVQVIDDDGAVESIEVEARDAEHARATVAALGADGRIGKVRLKRLHGNPGSTPRFEGGFDAQ